jgi:hypothetical protein
MTSNATQRAESQGIAAVLSQLVAVEGTAGHRYVPSSDLRSGKFATRNLADAIHLFCSLHGRHPGVIDLSALHTTQNAARSWLIQAVDGFTMERSYLTKLVVAAGPLPSTPGQAESESAVNGQCHALDMLARSDRTGCAIGAAITLVLDWHAFRDVLDHAAKRWGMTAPECALPSISQTLTLANEAAESSAVERAIAFGAQQILNQHRGLWDLLDARQIARGEY